MERFRCACTIKCDSSLDRSECEYQETLLPEAGDYQHYKTCNRCGLRATIRSSELRSLAHENYFADSILSRKQT